VRILVADDDLGSRLVAQSAVQRLGHECVTAADGDQAWRLIEQSRPDVLITDRDMPWLDGVTLCRLLRQREQQQDGYTYVVLLTGLDTPGEVTTGMQAGADDYLTKPLNPLYLQTRLLAAARVSALHSELDRARAALSRQAHTDPLTGLRNRLGLAADLEQLHNVSQRHGRSYCLAMCDLDHFKAYDRVYRYGVEEFLVLLPEQTLHQASPALERVRTALQTLAIEHKGAGRHAVLTLSAGLAASHPGRRIPSPELVAEADSALYQAKRSGRNRLTLTTADVS